MKKLTGLIGTIVLVFSCFFATGASAKELMSWGEHMSEDFSINQCVTIPGTPGIAKHCGPSKSVAYPCGNWKHPKKMCHHTIKGICTPAVPGTPDVKKCAHKGLGNFSVKVDGGVFMALDGISDDELGIANTVSVDMFGQHVVIPMSCKIALGTKTSICSNLLAEGALVFDNASGISCEIDGSNVKSISYPGVTANVCLDVDIDISKKTPQGIVGIRVDSGVDFGSATLVGHTVSLGGKSWSPTLFKAKFPQ